NVLADCLAKSSPLLSLQRGFRCEAEVLRWERRREQVKEEILRHDADIVGLCEVDHFDDFFEPELERAGFQGTFKRKRSPAKDGVAVFWRADKFDEGVRRTIFLEYGRQRTKAAQVAVLQRLWPRDRQTGKGVVVCAVHLRASSDDGFRVQQASALVSALQDFSRGDEQIILADVNSKQMMGSSRTEIANVFDYFAACGFKCAYTDLRLQHGHSSPKYTTWAGWASGDFKATCDHIFVSKGLHAQAVLDVPDADELAEKFPERLPNEFFPSDHLSLIADLVIPDSRLA
ncbi:NOCT, partial [Symbiodinium microadriaticum]